MPLSTQVIVVIKEIHYFTGFRELLFPNRNRPLDPMSDAAINKVISLLGYKGGG